MVIVPHIPVQLLVIHMIDQIHHLVQKWYVMGDQYEGIFIILQIPLQPFYMHLIQIVGGLIQQKDVRFFQEQPS